VSCEEEEGGFFFLVGYAKTCSAVQRSQLRFFEFIDQNRFPYLTVARYCTIYKPSQKNTLLQPTRPGINCSAPHPHLKIKFPLSISSIQSHCTASLGPYHPPSSSSSDHVNHQFHKTTKSARPQYEVHPKTIDDCGFIEKGRLRYISCIR
jgi:hypothetical protein